MSALTKNRTNNLRNADLSTREPHATTMASFIKGASLRAQTDGANIFFDDSARQ